MSPVGVAHGLAADAFVPGPRVRVAPIGQGALDGLTFAVKDLIDVEGAITGAGNPDWRADRGPALTSAPAVAALLAAGAALEGKTITDELAFSLEGINFHYGTPLNPAAPDRLPGGSSSGSASAVASGAVDFALGTDTGGSVRIPASFCGLYGFRPSHGRISLAGVVPFAPGYDTIGWFARDAATLARAGAVLLGAPEAPALTRFILAEDAFMLADEDVGGALLRHLPAALARHETIRVFDGGAAGWREAYRVLQGAEIWDSLGAWITARHPQFGPDIAPRFADAAAITADSIAVWSAFRAAQRARLAALLGPDTALILPTSPCLALPRGADPATTGDFYARALPLTSIAGHCGLPQVSLPLARVHGVPAGLSLVGPAGSDEALLALALSLSGPDR